MKFLDVVTWYDSTVEEYWWMRELWLLVRCTFCTSNEPVLNVAAGEEENFVGCATGWQIKLYELGKKIAKKL